MAKRILITGSREWVDQNLIHRAISEWVRDNVPQNEITTLVHGDASRGADRMARDFAQAMWWLEEEPHPADWEYDGRAAGFIRNQAMVDLGADVCLAFVRGASKGTKHCAGQAAKAGIPVVYVVDNEETYGVDSGV